MAAPMLPRWHAGATGSLRAAIVLVLLAVAELSASDFADRLAEKLALKD